LSELDSLIGHWVQVRTTGGSAAYGVHPNTEFGILEGFDDVCYLLKKWNGETLYLPADTVRDVIPLDEPSVPANTLLRASDAPEAPLLRPATMGDAGDPDKLLRPA
jgi:hypothetical protein